ncbi:conserved domain protein [Fibrobacter succinogenes subsp. succinogenes S85]|uniref:Conserved domain protein n=1 Tax=Fibrobacter succinogenes (strain ATCC 19169 / S85) TaxID=59374 RepID=C9RQT9_FIBSS|nr:fibro-slime family protein [Fibrobacter succinogenes subsp. succinogenes S85]ADL27219.1 conserved domain protein [Fibrobacter succinogenes subsp. succinogenes S85]
MRISGLLYRVLVCLAIFSAYAFAQTVAVAHIIYEGNVLYYADNESNFVYKAVEKNPDGTFTIEFTNERLANGKKDVRRLQFGVGCNGNTCHTDLSPDNKPLLGELFPGYKENVTDAANIVKQEVWIVINEDKTLTISDTKPVVAVKPKKHIRFLTPWTNTNAVMYLNDTENYMSAVGSPYCGWFESKVSKPSGSANVYFKQTIGTMFVGADGTTEDETTVTPINLDSSLALSDTIWVVAYQYGAPEVHTNYPGVLGECLPKILPVMMFDWYDGSMNSDGSKNGLSYGDGGAGRTGFDIRGVPMFGVGTSEDFGPDGCKGTPMTGMVEKQLGPNGVPVRAKNFPSGCTNATHLNNWFLPEVVYNDGVNSYTNVTCRDLELTLTDDGFWLGQKDDESPEGGLFLLDDFRWLDSAKTIENPHYDSLSGGDDIPGYHNYGFTMKIQAEFVYVKGQYFEFNGDDDVWVFINNKLVVDIGGQHKKVRKAVNLDTLNLTPGETYPFHIFYAERKRTQSNFMMRTSIDLKVESSMFLTDHSTDSTLIKKEVWQNIREKTLACDFSSNSETKRTERGPSNFTLFGKSLPMTGVALSKLDTAYYSGITITNDFTMLTINTTNISRMQTLPPGTYYVRVSLKNNPKEYKDVYFTIPPTELPNIAFADIIDTSYCFIADVIKQDTLCLDKYWRPLGNEASRDISSDTLPINLNKAEKLWAGRIYPINVSFVEDWARSYSGMAVQVSTNDPKLIPCDSLGSPLPNNEFVLIEGKNTFFVKASGAVTNGTITISSTVAKNKSVNWTNINIAEPPVPQIETAFIYDRNGDGRGDSVWVSFNKPLGGNSVLNSISFTFGLTHYSTSNIVYNEGDLTLSLTADGDGFGTSISTGGALEPYNGKITAQYTYTNPEDHTVSNFSVDGLLGDGIGPVILAAEISYTSDGKTMLTLTFSEGLTSLDPSSSLFGYRSYGSGSLSSIVSEADFVSTTPANRWKLLFSKKAVSDIIPIVGDSIRIRPPSEGGLALDLIGIPAHDLNPWVRITGEQRITVTSPPVVTMDKDSPNFELTKEIVRSDSATVPILVQSEKPLTATQVGEIYGTQGHYLGDMNMSELVENEISEIAKVVKTATMYEDKEAVKNGSPSTSVSLETIISMLDQKVISPKEAKERFGLSEVIINAYNNELLNKNNLHNYMHGTDDDIKTIAESMADKTALSYKTIYFSSLGQFVNSDRGQIACNDDIFKTDGAKNCLGNEGHLYLAWNMRAKNGRLAGTGVYIARLEIQLIVNGKRITKRTQDFLWGFRHGDLAIIDFDINQ